MAINQNWTKWITASIVAHFNTLLSPSMKVYFENEKRDTREEKYVAEIRVDGPLFGEISKGVHHIYCEVNLLIQCIEDYTYMYKQQELLGLAQSAFTNIQVRKYGNKTGDDESLVFCLSLIEKSRKSDRIVTSNFGEVEPNTKMLQATVEGHYELYYTGD